LRLLGSNENNSLMRDTRKTGKAMQKIKRLANPRSYSRTQLLLFVLFFAVFGVAALKFSRADDLSTSTDPNTVILQYRLPHAYTPDNSEDINDDGAEYPPLTLYGDGTILCGPTDHDAPVPSQVTSRKLTPEEIADLMQRIANTGFLGLKHEYYKQPIAEQQEIIRVNFVSGEHFVMYYADVPAPAAYTKVRQMLEQTCATIKDPYLPAQLNIQLKNVKSSLGKAKENLSSLDQPAADIIKSKLNRVQGELVGSQADITVDSTQAKTLLNSFYGKSKKVVTDGSQLYAVRLVPLMPEEKNPFNPNYEKIRTEDQKLSLLQRLDRKITGKAYAAGNRPVRVVILVPKGKTLSSTEKTNLSFVGSYLSKTMRNFYCAQIGSCYDATENQSSTNGYSFQNGNLTQSQYMNCPSSVCSAGPYSAVISNVASADSGTISRSDVDTLVLPSWCLTPDPNVKGGCAVPTMACGIANTGGTLAVIDPYAPTASNPQAVTSAKLPDGTIDTSYVFCKRNMGSVHELAHTFGLSHTSYDNIMRGQVGAALYPVGSCGVNEGGPFYFPPCAFDSGQIATIKQSPYFPITASSSSTGGTSGSTGGMTTTGPTWHGPENLGGALTSGVAVASWGSGHLDVFARGTDNALYHKYWVNGAWSGWESLGGQITSDPAAVAWPGHVEVFARGTDYQLYHRWFDSCCGWQQWDPMGGQLTSSPAVASQQAGHMDVFVRGTDNQMYHRWYYTSSGWSGWASEGGILGSDPAATSWGFGREDVVVKCSDNVNMCHKAFTWNGSYYQWFPWDGAGTYSSAYFSPAITTRGVNDLIIYQVAGSNLQIFAKVWTGSSWSGWLPVPSAYSNASPDATGAWGNGRVDLVYRGTDNQLKHMAFW
jgi:hypothetical protein